MITLQNIIYPDSSLSHLPIDLYLRQMNGGCKFNTFFNVLNAGKLKQYFSIHDLSLQVRGKGDCIITLWGSNNLQSGERLDSWAFSSLDTAETLFPINDWGSLGYQFLFIEISNSDFCQSANLSFVTESPVVNQVRLGVTIVHFNRKNWVLPAIKRLKEGLLDDSEYKEKVSVVIIDNSQNISEHEASGVEVIPNKNLGGTGGFTRGLLYFKDHQFTHCLFMDDDASCEVESIKRTWALLAYSKVSKFAVAGSLLLDEKPSLLYEKGAIFEDTHKAICGGFDMVETNDLVEVEKEDLVPNYGGWWFFAFKLNDISHFPFPFFVRGDDLMFSLINKFSIYTTNGIGCWGDDFASKSTPLACYLDARSVLLNSLCSGRKSVPRTLVFLSKHFILHLLSFNYASVRAIRSSLSDTTLGVSFWGENLDTVRIRKEIATFSENEKMAPLNLDKFSYDVCPIPEHRYIKGVKPALGFDVYFKALVLNGAFLPNFLMKKRYLLIPKGKYGGLKHAFRYNKIIYYDDKTSTGYVAKLNRKLMLQESFLYVALCLKILLNRRKYKCELEKAVETYTKESFWRSVYK